MEKEILMKVKHPFLVSMDYIFQSETKLYFVMTFVKGGELYTLLSKEKWFSEQRAKFYAVQIILGIGHLHSQNIIYRDIKPENILVNEDGYLLLADFGLAKQIAKDAMTQSFCGTPEYLAPEIIWNEGHNASADWWTIGILIYEMVVGFPPFYHKNQTTMYDLIQNFPVKYPDPSKHKIMMSEDLKDFISRLLDKNYRTWLGSQEDVKEVLSHPWLSDIDIPQIMEKRVKPEYVPTISGDDDTSQFDASFTEMSIDPTQIPEKNLELIKKRNKDFEQFNN